MAGKPVLRRADKCQIQMNKATLNGVIQCLLIRIWRVIYRDVGGLLSQAGIHGILFLCPCL